MDWKIFEVWKGWVGHGIEALIGICIIYGSKWVWKNALPYIKNIKAVFKINSRITILESKVKDSENCIHILNDKFLAFLRTSENPYFITNNKGELIFANDTWLKSFGFHDMDDAKGIGYLQAIPKEAREAMIKENENFLKHPGNYQGDVTFEHLEDASLIYARCRGYAFYNNNGEFEAIIGRLKILSILPKMPK